MDIGDQVRVTHPQPATAWIQQVGKDRVSLYIETWGGLYSVPVEKINETEIGPSDAQERQERGLPITRCGWGHAFPS